MPNAARVTQQFVEVIADEDSADNLRVTRQYIEVLFVAGAAPPALNQLVQTTIVSG
jgi:hypothetical protein